MNFYNQLSCLSNVFVVECDHNDKIFSSINSMGSLDMRSHILKFFVELSVKKSPNIYVDKKELEMVTNTSYRSFNRSLNDIMGRARAYGKLEIIGNIVSSHWFKRTSYTPHEVFHQRLGFTPTKLYLDKLHKTFPDNKIFLVCDFF